MSVTTSIFSFDHGQKKLHNAIGVEEAYVDDLQEQIGNILKDHLFDEDRNIKDDLCPSMLVESSLHNFSYNQLVVIAGMFLQSKLDEFADKMDKKLKHVVKKISLSEDEIPPHIKDIFVRLAEKKTDGLIDADDLPQEIRDFLDNLTRRSEEDDE